MFPVEAREHEVTSVWSPPCLKHEVFSPLRTDRLDKQSLWYFKEEAHPSYGQLIKAPLVSRTWLCSSAHLNLISCGSQIIFYFQLSCCSHYRFGGYKCWMTRERGRGGVGGGRRIPFCLKDKILEMPPRTASLKRSSTWQRLAQLSLCQMIIWELNLISIILPRHISIKSAIRVLTHLWTCYFFS